MSLFLKICKVIMKLYQLYQNDNGMRQIDHKYCEIKSVLENYGINMTHLQRFSCRFKNKGTAILFQGGKWQNLPVEKSYSYLVSLLMVKQHLPVDHLLLVSCLKNDVLKMTAKFLRGFHVLVKLQAGIPQLKK